MIKLKKYDFKGKEIGEESFEDKNFKDLANAQMIKDYIVALRKNARQWSANTKGRKEVNVTGAKPHAQKGTGKARQGCYAAAQFRGGGVVFGPKPKFNQHVKVNKKEKRKIISTLIIEKIMNNKAIIVEVKDEEIKKTKQVDAFLSATNLKGTRVLFLSKHENSSNFKRCLRNINKTQLVDISSVNGYELMLSHNLIVTDTVLDELKKVVNKSETK
ncbi:MAG: 50S ribosomal protein L4 [Candidatus Anoxychlamydiales bacterium]|nr:50S ribosomal protein L4 [Candidatus Anoxychlamydiales bacterium]